MHTNKLKAVMSLREISVNEMIKRINEKGVNMSRASYYRRMANVQEFDRAEILAIVEVLDLSKDEMMDIFFE